jgi:hypothetical protein
MAINNIEAGSVQVDALGREARTLTVSSGEATSNAVKCNGRTLAAVETPGTLTQTALRFSVSRDGVTYVPLMKDDNTRYSITVAVSSGYSLNLALLKGWEYVKINMGGNEGADRVFGIVLTGV